MITADSLQDRFRRGRAELGPLRFVLLCLIVLGFFGGGLVLLLIDEQPETRYLYLAFVFGSLALFRLIERPERDWLGLLSAATAAVWLGYYFELIPYPLIQGPL